MRIAVIGAGIVGVTTAHELAVDGHEVVVFDRHSSVAAESSFANGGVLAPSPLGLRGVLGLDGSLLRELIGAGRLRQRPTLDGVLWRWLWRWSRAANLAHYRAHRAELQRLGRYSRERLHALALDLAFEFERAPGLITLWRSEQERNAAAAELGVLRELGVELRELDAAACRMLEPGLNREQALAGGAQWSGEEFGNCRQFAHLLRETAERAGVEFRFATIVRGFGADDSGGRLLHVEQMALTTGFTATRAALPAASRVSLPMSHRTRAAARYLDPVSSERFDAIVLASGSEGALLEAAGLKLPLLPVQGYSLTAPLRAPDRGPRGGLVDARHGITLGRLGQRVRVAGGNELGGPPQRQRRKAVEALYACLNDWFPGAAHIARPQLWKGARPALPDGPPLVGPAPGGRLWLNLGHGDDGWALACGSARLLADQIAGRAPAFDPSALSPQRYLAAAPG